MSQESKHLWRLDVRDRKRLIELLARAAAGDARISFEGDLSKCRLLPLEPDRVNAILDAVPAAALDEDLDLKPWPHDGDVLHVQIEKERESTFSPRCSIKAC